MTNVFQKAAKTCNVHGKKSYTSRDLAKQASREMHDPGMREYRCDVEDGYWHIGHLPEPVRNGQVTADEHYGRVPPSPPPGPLTFRPGPENIKPLNGPKPAIADNSIESLLAAAESSGVDEAVKLAGQIRVLLVQLIDEIRIGQQERSLVARIAELEAQRDRAVAELRDLRGEPEPVVVPSVRSVADNFPPSGNQAEIRAWARENGFEVKGHGAIAVRVREAYEQAHGGKR